MLKYESIKTLEKTFMNYKKKDLRMGKTLLNMI